MSARPRTRPRPAPRRAPRLAACLTAAAAAAAAPPDAAGAQPLAARVAAADGPVAVRFATRPAACGDGRDFVAFGDRFAVGATYTTYGHGRWSRQTCVPGPALVTLIARGGAASDVRVRVGGARPAAPAARDLGVVGAPEAAAYFLALAGRSAGRDAERAMMAAALADSADVWRPLLALARGHADVRAARGAMHWLGAVAPAEAAPAIAAVLRDPAERREVREGAAAALAFVPDDAGVPALAAAASGAPAGGGGDPWARDRAVFWLGNARDPRARATLRTLAAADTAPEPVRGQAIFVLGHIDRDDDAGDANGAFLRGLYPRLASARLQDRVIQSVAQSDDAAGHRWLLGLATDARQPVAARKQALFWAGQQEAVPVGDLLAANERLTGGELRRHFTFVLSQRREDAAIDGLIAIARADADRDVRRQALFWLGQSRSPRARRYLESVVAP